MYILSIVTGHNASTTLLKDGDILFHIEEERLTRIKRDGTPFKTLLNIPQFTDTIDLFLISGTHDTPQAEWIGISYYEALLKKMDINVKETKDLGDYHHDQHCYTSFYNSGFDDAIVMIVDGAGSELDIMDEKDENPLRAYEAETIYRMNYNETTTQYQNFISNEEVKEINYIMHTNTQPTIVKMYEGITTALGWHPIEAGKTMGLSSYGKYDPKIPDLYDAYLRGKSEIFKPSYPANSIVDITKFGIEIKDGVAQTDEQFRKNLAKKIQVNSMFLFEQLLIKAIELNPDCKNICVGGGYGLNVVNNGSLIKKYPDYNFWFEPACNDSGNSIGACKHHYLENGGDIEKIKGIKDYYMGYQYLPNRDLLRSYDNTKITTNKEVAKLINEGNIVAIYQGRSEAGPRALGNRSFMFNPTIKNSKDLMNKVKKREYFRPFAASVLEEKAHEYFDMYNIKKSPYMMIAFNTKKDKIDEIPGVVHVDGTTRIQTVTKEDNKNYREIIEEFYKLSGVPMIMNTSFNMAGEPLIETVEEAIHALENEDFNYLYLADINILITKDKNEL